LIAGTIAGMIASSGWILGELFPESKTLINNIFVIPVFFSIFIMFWFLIPLAWRSRKDPLKKIMVYTGFGFLGFAVVFSVVIFILAQMGVFG
jgi:hypothetical protein